MNIVLIGMRSCGKSNVSRRLSLYTKRTVLSTDVLISYENQGDEILEIVKKNNGDWHIFRELEYLVVKKATCQKSVIIDTGGGIVVDLDQDGREIYSERKINLLKKNGLLIWLRGDIDQLINRVKGDSSRPQLSKVKSDKELMESRLPFYQKAADIVIDIDGKRRRQIAVEIMQCLGTYPEFSNLKHFKPKIGQNLLQSP